MQIEKQQQKEINPTPEQSDSCPVEIDFSFSPKSHVKQLFKSFINTHNSQDLRLSNSIKIDDFRNWMILNPEPALNPSSTEENNHIIESIQTFLNVLSTFDFAGLNGLEIQVRNFKGTISEEQHFRMIQSLNGLKNLASILILEVAEHIQNIESLYLFFSFEITNQKQSYLYQSKSNNREITIQQHFKKGKLYFSFNFVNNIISEQDKEFISATIPYLENLFELAQNRQKQLRQLMSNKIKSDQSKSENHQEPSSVIPQSQPMKKIRLYMHMPFHSMINMVAGIKTMLLIWEQEFDRIQTIDSLIPSHLSKSSESELLQESLIELRSARLSSKLHLGYQGFRTRQFFSVAQVMKFIKGVNFVLETTVDLNSLHPLLEQLESGDFDKNQLHLKHLFVHTSDLSSIPFLIRLALCFPKLTWFRLNLLTKENEINLSDSFDIIMGLIQSVKRVEFASRIVFEKGKLKIKQIAKDPDFFQIAQMLPRAIVDYGKAINFKLSYDLSVPNAVHRKHVFPVLKSLLQIPTIIQLQYESTIEGPEIQNLLRERTSFYMQVLAYEQQLKQYMTFNPIIILRDLIDFE